MISTESKRGKLVLLLGNVAGMVDLVALPLWISGLMQSFHLDPQQAGLQVTFYIFGVFIASVVLSPVFHRISPRLCATFGFALAACGFLILQAGSSSMLITSLAHAMAGIGAGTGLSSVHGTIGQSAMPDRLFAFASFGVGLLAIPFFVIVPRYMQDGGVQFLFAVLGILMFLAALVSAIAFPTPVALAGSGAVPKPLKHHTVRLSAALRRGVMLAFIGVALMATGQAMAFSFVDRLGAWRGFAPEMVARVFIISGLINLFAPVVAALLQRHVNATRAAMVALTCHAVLTFTAMHAVSYSLFLAASASFVFFIIFGHTFMFGLIARLDPSGRASASTPAMLMIGSAIGPVAGGTFVKYLGYPSLGIVTAFLALSSAACFFAISRSASGPTANGILNPRIANSGVV